VSSGNTSKFNFLIKVDGVKEEDYDIATKHADIDLNQIYRSYIIDSDNKRIPGYHTFFIPKFPYPPAKTSLLVGLATGTWEIVEKEIQNWSDYSPDDITWSFDNRIVRTHL